MKKCTTCNLKKELTDFGKQKSAKDGLRYACKSCVNEKMKKWREANIEYEKQYYQNNKERIKEYKKKHYESNKEKIQEYKKSNKERSKEYYKEYYESNKEKIIQRNKEHYKNNIEANKERSKEYYQANKERSKERSKEYQQANKKKIKKYLKEYVQINKERRNKYLREKRKVDPLYKMKGNLRTRTSIAFKNKGYNKNTKTQEMLGVNWEVCKAHIERQFTKGMTWDNQGEWHIDHIIPLASANTKQELKKLCHYSNLQPLWAVDNLMKSAKINGQQNKFRF